MIGKLRTPRNSPQPPGKSRNTNAHGFSLLAHACPFYPFVPRVEEKDHYIKDINQCPDYMIFHVHAAIHPFVNYNFEGLHLQANFAFIVSLAVEFL